MQYWLPHAEHVWLPGRVQDERGAEATLLDGDGGTVKVAKAKLDKYGRVDEAHFDGVDDVASLAGVCDGALLQTMKTRYLAHKIYTRVGRIVVCLNPFQSVPIFSQQYLTQYATAADSMDHPPHIYAVGIDAVQGLRKGERNQAVVIGGESGAGKTESAKLIMGFVSEAAGGGGSRVGQMIMQTNPLLEAYGNAMTVRNNNSSRFGKWLDLQFNKMMGVAGCSIEHYLLEVTRCCSQTTGERSYHIFFQLIKSRASCPMLASLNLEDVRAYRYLKNSELNSPGVDDLKEFQELIESCTALEFGEETTMSIFRVTAAVLVLGNIEFANAAGGGSEELCLVDDKPLNHAASLLDVDAAGLKKALLFRKIVIGKDVTETPLKDKQAEAARDGLARQLYGLLFAWMIIQMNKGLAKPPEPDQRGPGPNLLGILDIAGFESFEINSLEQLQINLGNENLQQHFTTNTFQKELDDYNKEGITLDLTTTSADNKDILELIDAKGGVLDILDEEISLAKATDLSFTTKVLKTHAKHKRIIVPKFPGKPIFGIDHYAGPVTYTCDGFLEKSNDKPPDDAVPLLEASSVPAVRGLCEVLAAANAPPPPESAGPAKGGKSKKKQTLVTRFRASMRELMAKINMADPHYLRCIKPNKEKVPWVFTATMVMDQIKVSGVIQAIMIRQAKYSSRLPFQQFLMRYRTIFGKRGPPTTGDAQANSKALCDMLATEFGLAGDDFAFGKTKIFSQTKALDRMEKEISAVQVRAVKKMQALFRGFSLRKSMRETKEIMAQMTRWLQKYVPGVTDFSHSNKVGLLMSYTNPDKAEASLKELSPIMLKASRLPLVLPGLKACEAAKKRIQEELDVLVLLREELRQKSRDTVKMDKLVGRARMMGLTLQTVAQVEQRSMKLIEQLPLIKAMEKAIEVKDLLQAAAVVQRAEALGMKQSPDEWLEDLKAKPLFQQCLEMAGKQDELDRVAEAEEQKRIDEEERRKAEEEAALIASRGPMTAAQLKFAKRDAESKDLTNVFTPEAQSKVLTKAKTKTERDFAEHRRKKRATITGFTDTQSAGIKGDLARAAEECDNDALERLLGLAVEEGIPLAEQADARTRFNELQDEVWCLEMVQSYKRKMLAPTEASLRTLNNLAKQLEQIAGASLEASEGAREARAAQQKAMRKREVMMRHRVSIFEATNAEELRMAEAAFGTLATFSRLKQKDKWRGHKIEGTVTESTKRDNMLLHSIIGINDSLTRPPDRLSKEELQQWHQSSLESFQNIQKWMGDNYVQETQREGCRTGVVDLAIGKYAKPPPIRPEMAEVYHQHMRDEIFVQLVKQLTDNQSKAQRSTVQGWQLMLLLCKAGQPSEDLNEFVKYMLNKTIAGAKSGDQDTREQARIAQRCLNALKSPVLVAKTHAFTKLDESGVRYQMLVVLIDGTEVKIEVSGSSPLKEVGAQLGRELGVLCPVSVGNTFDFSFFQLRDGTLAPRLLHDDLAVSDIAEKWDELRAATGQTSRIGWRRRFLKRNEELSEQDLAHAALSYRQAVCDFLHETVSGGDSDDLICEIGAAVLCTEFNPSSAAAAALILQDDIMIEKLLPMHLFVGMTPEDLDSWRTRVLNVEARMRLQMRGDSCNVFTRMRETFALLRRTCLFGTHSWPVLQLGGNAVPQKLAAVDSPPSKYMVFNPKDLESHIWVFVDRRGLHLWPAEGIHGNVLPRTFTFRAEANVDRLVAWGARRAFVQFVVELHEDAAKAAKGEDVRHLLTLKCPQALDIVYIIYAVLVEPRGKT